MLLNQELLRPVLLATSLAASHTAALEFDYIIIGAGPSGLTIANRLSESPNITVAVIEAGGDVRNNPNVTGILNFSTALGTAIDWQYESINQTYADGRTIGYASGKALGGTSTINGMTYVRAEKAQIDTWEAIGNAGWNWETLLPYYKKSEHFDTPTAAQLAAGASYVPADHGVDGPLRVGYPYQLINGSLYGQVEQAWGSLGIPPNPDANGGSVRGFIVWQSTLDRDANVREDAARAYYYPIEGRSNLRVFLNTTANRIVWEDGDEVVANGVEITSSNGTVSTLSARKEVIVSAGSLRTPAILELSGIGNPLILNKYGIPTKVDLPSVGENLQDQPNTVIAMNTTATTPYDGITGYAAFSSTSDFLGNLTQPDLGAWAAQVSAAVGSSVNATALESLFKVQYELLEQGVPNAETIMEPTIEVGQPANTLLFSAFWILMPFSRGNVHIGSADPLGYPLINPNYFLLDFDLTVSVAIAKWTRRFWAAQPLADFTSEISPGFDVVPANATDEQWGEWLKGAFNANSHPLGTAAMMPKELGGVVDNRLKVYGTANVRVVDASILPFQVSGHLTSTLYAVSEKAADIIKEDA